MKLNKILFLIAVSLIPIVVISFEEDKTNFIMEEKEKNVKQDEKTISVKILTDNKVQELDLEDYVVGVVAAEMPASFNIEALKAQAVASRTYALYKKGNSDGEYDLTDDKSTQVYINNDKMKEKWLDEYDYYYAKVKEAVNKTKGQIITYNDKLIEALYFSMSSGTTEDASYVFGETVDYLKPVESKYDNETINNFKVIKTFTIDDFKKSLNLTCNKVIIDNIKRDNSNYVSSLNICGDEYDGIELRYKLGLRSANFDIDVKDIITITTYGYGHGVGMSQYGANGYAENGLKYDEILKHYYKDIEIKNIKDV